MIGSRLGWEQGKLRFWMHFKGQLRRFSNLKFLGYPRKEEVKNECHQQFFFKFIYFHLFLLVGGQLLYNIVVVAIFLFVCFLFFFLLSN